MNSWQIAWRNLMRRKLRTLLTVMSIVIGVASTFGVIASVDSAKKAFPLYLKAAFGKADYTLNGTEAYFPEEVYGEAQKLPNSVSVAALKQNAKLHLEQDGLTAIQKRVELKGYSRLDTALTQFDLIKGDLNAGGAVITDRTAKVWKADIGGTIAFDTDNGVKTIEVTAIVKYTAELMGPSSWGMAKYHPWAVAVPLTVVQNWFGLSGKIESVQIKALPGLDAAAAAQQADGLARRYGNIYMQPVILDFDSQFRDADTFFFALYIAGFLGIALSAFVIFNSLYTTVHERKKEFAVLKTIGYTPEQLRAFVLFEVLLLSFVGTAAGLLIGYGLALLLKSVIFALFSVHDAGGMVLVKGLAVSVLAGVAIPVAVSLYPMRKAGQVSVIAVLKENRAEPAPFRYWPGVIGLLLIAAAFQIKHLLMILPMLAGFALVFPYLFKMFVLLLKPLYTRLAGFNGQVSARNLTRNMNRSSMTSVILCLGIAMILLMSSLNSAVVQTYERAIYSSYGGNLDVMFHHTEKTDLEKLRAIDGVADAQTYPLQSAVWNLQGQKRKLPVYGVGADWIDRFPLFAVQGTSHSALIRALGNNEILLDRLAYGAWGGSVGESISLETLQGVQSFKVAGVVDTMKNSGYGAFMNENGFREHFGLKFERNALVLRKENASPLQIRENIYNEFGIRIEKMFGPEDIASVVGSTLTGSFSVINFLIVLSIVISGIGITNTLMMSIMERIRELAMMRAVGVTRGQIVRIVVLEGFGIGLAATAIGCAFGMLLIYVTSTFLEIHSLTYRFGVSGIILAAVGSFGMIVSLLSSFTPASRAAKTNLSEALRYE
ncbi:FtsX-like permease family protein [Paenibacillus hamazuiensis]|uniref:FtsX-like permease family protein n=1 Tax=Paenibacillus hamazuiensis TaxID=2936508 RepID=UPI00200C331E|nr:ABC transporter permease [Paenibacillus hamazuiensis]